MRNELVVRLFGDPVGTLTSTAGRLAFTYQPEWLARPDAMPVSGALPLQPEPFEDQRTRPYFAGLLPEGQLRRLIARQLQVSAHNDYALLDGIGGECAGAVSLLPTGEVPEVAGVDEIRWLDDAQLDDILEELPRRPMLAGADGLRLSLAGAQDKLPVVFDGQRIGLAIGGQPSTHILKPSIDGVEDSVTNEGFCLALARRLGMIAAEGRVHGVGDRRFLLVTRYDRCGEAQGRVTRLHQEDFCQALGVVPEMKYQNEGGPDLAQCFDLVRRVTRPSAPQILRLLDYVIFNALIGNHDAHAKNFSLLYAGKSAVLAPFYDVLSTAVYPTLTPKMAMKIGGKYKFSEVEVQHWDQFAEAVGLGKAQARKRILALAKSMPLTARALQSSSEHGFAGHAVVEHIVTLIEQRCARTVRRLSAPAAA